MLYNQSEMDHIKDLLKIPAPNTTGVNEVQPINEGVNNLLKDKFPGAGLANNVV